MFHKKREDRTKSEKAIVGICFRVRANKKEDERWRNIDRDSGRREEEKRRGNFADLAFRFHPLDATILYNYLRR